MPSEPARPLHRSVPPKLDAAPETHAQVLPHRRATDLRALRQALRHELERWTDLGADTEPIAIFGFAAGRLHRLASADGTAPDSLLGLRVPDRYDAVAAIAASIMTTSTRNHADAVLAVAVCRDGHELCFLAGDAEIAETWQPQGWLIDACRRSVGLATRPSFAQPADLSLVLWLDYLLVALVEHRVISWADAVECCPVTSPIWDTTPEVLGERLANTVPSWSLLRTAAAGGAPLPVPMRADHAAWMDDAMFTRWVLGFFPELDDLRNDVAFLASNDVAERVERVIRAARYEP